MAEQSQEHDIYKGHSCVTGSLVGATTSGSKLKVIPMFCHKWTCPRCRAQKTNIWRDVAKRGKPERFITLTLRADETKTPKQMAYMGKQAFARLVQKLRRRYGVFEYLLVWELTKKGTPHIHMLQRGTWIPKQKLSDLWCSVSGSFIVDIQQIRQGSDVSRYITKYMGKTIGDCSDILNGFRMLQKSKNWIVEKPEMKEPKPEQDIDDVESWSFCSATPKEIIRIALEEYGCTLHPDSSGTCLTLEGPPDPDLAYKIVHHFDAEFSYT